MIKHYIEFLYPGIFVAESSAEEVNSRDIDKIKIPENCHGFRFYDRQETIAEDGETLSGEPRNYSGTYYRGRAMTLKDVKSELPDHRNLIENMEGNSWKKIVKTIFGNFYPLKDLDQILDEDDVKRVKKC
jgi:hypothetical protein